MEQPTKAGLSLNNQIPLSMCGPQYAKHMHFLWPLHYVLGLLGGPESGGRQQGLGFMTINGYLDAGRGILSLIPRGIYIFARTHKDVNVLVPGKAFPVVKRKEHPALSPGILLRRPDLSRGQFLAW